MENKKESEKKCLQAFLDSLVKLSSPIFYVFISLWLFFFCLSFALTCLASFRGVGWGQILLGNDHTGKAVWASMGLNPAVTSIGLNLAVTLVNNPGSVVIDQGAEPLSAPCPFIL